METFALIYHDVASPAERESCGFPGPSAARYKLDWPSFESHLDAIQALRTGVGLVQRDARVALTFDDGGASALAIASSLERRGWHGHFFVTTSRIGTPGFLDSEGVLELARRGHDVGSHSHSHPMWADLSDRQIEEEWVRSREVLGDILGIAPSTAAVPGGYLPDSVVEHAARAGYGLLMTSKPTARSEWHHGMRLQGRFTIWSGTAAERAAAYAKGDPAIRAATWIAWQAKRAPRRFSPHAYEAARRRWASVRRA